MTEMMASKQANICHIVDCVRNNHGTVLSAVVDTFQHDARSYYLLKEYFVRKLPK